MPITQQELDVFVPRLDLYEVANIAAYMQITPGAAVIGIATGDGELELHFQPRSSSDTWADQLHVAAQRHLDREAPAVVVERGLMQHVATYDPRDGTATIDPSWDARRAVRAWLGRGRRELVEELYTTHVPEHPQRRVILFNVRSGDVPQSVRAYAHRTGQDHLIEEAHPPPPPPPPAPRTAPEHQRTVALTPQQVEEIAGALALAPRPVDEVELRRQADGTTIYRLRFLDGNLGPWSDADPPAEPEQRVAAGGRRPARQTMGHATRALRR